MTEDFYYGLVAYLEALADGDFIGARNAEQFMVNAALIGD